LWNALNPTLKQGIERKRLRGFFMAASIGFQADFVIFTMCKNVYADLFSINGDA
jgi:hypothetical protein